MSTKVYRASPSPYSATTSLPRQGNWLWGYGLGLLLMGLLIFAHRQPFSRSGHMLFQGAIVLLVYGLLICWRQSKHTGLEAAKPVAKPRFVYIVYPPVGKETIDKPTASLQEITLQPTSFAVLPRRDGVSLEDQRNS